METHPDRHPAPEHYSAMHKILVTDCDRLRPNEVPRCSIMTHRVRAYFEPIDIWKDRTASTDISNIEFVALIASLMALVALAINMILPAYAAMTQHFGLTTPTRIGLAVSLLYAGLAAGQIIFGTLSDSIGRKPAMMTGLGIFILGTLLSWLAPAFPMLISGQIIQGIGLGAPRVVTMAIVRDRYEGPLMARMMSFIMVVFALVPMVSPYVGQTVIAALEWRALFAVFAAGGISAGLWFAIRLPETHPVSNRAPLALRSTLSIFGQVLTNWAAVTHAAALGIVSGAYIASLNLSQDILQFQYGLGSRYPVFFAMLSLSLATASFINGRAVIAIGMERLVKAGLVCISGLSAALGTLTVSIPSDPALPALIGYLMAMSFCFGILVSNLNAMAMRSLGATAGTGAALVGAVTTFVSVPLAIMVGNAYHGSVLPLVEAYGLFSLLGLALVAIVAKKSKRVTA
ncbi:MAG: multidrug effflux MFS transporter [Novosphingobium sp.]